MTSLKLTKRALLSSVVALVLCVAMLIGTTYAWFTSSVTSSGNIIQSGTLNVTLEYADEVPANKDDALWKDASKGAIFNYTKWEPGYTDVKYIKIENEGSLDLQYVLTIVPNETGAEVDLAKVIDVYMFEGAVAVTREQIAAATPVGTVADLIASSTGAAKGVLYADEAKGNVYETFTVVLKMQETAGNEYQGLSLGGGFSVNLLATQLASEYDAFDNQYDAGATLPVVGTGSTAVGTPDAVTGTYTIKVLNTNTTDSSETRYVATVVVKEESVADEAQNINVIVKEDDPQSQSSLGIDVEGSVQTFEITVEGIKDGNTEEIEVYLYVGKNKNVGNVVYHTLADGTVEELVGLYNPTTGQVKFSTTSFSPFSVVIYDEPFEPTDPTIPTATITKLEGEQNYEWGFAGTQLEGIIELVDPDELDVYYSFKADQTIEQAHASDYAQWKCDYFVKVDGVESLAERDIILGGVYGGYTIAFTNIVEVDGDTWIPMLLMMSDGWTYEAIVEGVGEFVCGVKDGGNLAAAGATFTVQLRLINPEAEDPSAPAEGEYIVINEVVYDFATGESTIAK